LISVWWNMKTEISDRTRKYSTLEVIAKAVAPELAAEVADTLPAPLGLHSWGRARSAFCMRHIRAAIENAEFLTKARALLNADDSDGQGMCAAFTELERVQMISLCTEVFAAQKLKLLPLSSDEARIR
jgi:hypothetical protein